VKPVKTENAMIVKEVINMPVRIAKSCHNCFNLNILANCRTCRATNDERFSTEWKAREPKDCNNCNDKNCNSCVKEYYD